MASPKLAAPSIAPSSESAATEPQEGHSAAAAHRAALAPLAGQAVERVRQAGGPVLLCFAAPLPTHDPLAVLHDLGGSGEDFRFYWEQPSAGLALAAGGVAQRFTAEGAERFRTVAEQVERALGAAVTGAVAGECQGPYALGGFSFFDRLEPDRWPGFGAAQLVVPQWMALRRGGEHLGLVTAAVGAQDSADAVLDALAAALERLHAAAGSTAAAPSAENGNGRNRAFRQEAREDGRARWLDVVRLARERIRDGRLSKVVLARALDIVCEVAPSPLGLLRRLRGAYPDCYNFMIDPGAGQLFLGATPERMARFGSGRVSVAAMAGTMPRGATAEADAGYARQLLESRKEREEHRIVVDGILAALSGLGPLHWAEQPEVVKLTNLQHLSTPITLAPERPLKLLALLERLHPTPAVGGHPREEAFALIRECERFERGWYAAPVGWMNARGEGEFAVALRTGTVAGTRLQLFAGGGIVADSDPEREYEETQIKFEPLLSALASE